MSLLVWMHDFLFYGGWLIRLLLLPAIVLRKEKPAACLFWLAIVFLEPWLGASFYLLLGENRLGRKRLARRQRRHLEFVGAGHRGVEPQHILAAAALAGPESPWHTASQLGGLPLVGGNTVELMTRSDTLIDRLIADIDAAEHHVHLLFYIYADDHVGQQVAAALVRARRRGVACRLLADGVGSRRLFRRLAPELRQQGVEVLAALPVNLLRMLLARMDLRNHRKLAIIDGQIAYTGSQNIIRPTYGHRRAGAWHDIMARIRGPVVQQLQDIFLEDWFHESGTLLEQPGLFPPAVIAGHVAVQAVPTGPDAATEEFQDLIVKAIFLARQRVVITSPYFVPQEAMLLALRLAAQRGVRVELVVPRRSDHPIVDAAGAFYCEHLMRFGARVFRYQRGMLHAKTMTVDDKFAMFGSANFDIRSFTLNFELNLILHDPGTVAQLRHLQEGYQRHSLVARPGAWPSRSWPNQFKMNLAKLLSPLL
jgi:cardiolipin synthase